MRSEGERSGARGEVALALAACTTAACGGA